jgi:probable rRNA maturation factor
MINIQIATQFIDHIEAGIIEITARTTLNVAGIDENTQLSVAIETDETLRELNNQFLGINAPTDVLSFPSDEFDPDEQIHYIGDVIISYPRAETQAAKAGHEIIVEIQLLVVHGVLHLLGFDHGTDMEKQKMWLIQETTLKILGCKLNQLPE